MNSKIKKTTEALTTQGVLIIFRVLLISAIFGILALGYFFATSPMHINEKIEISTIPFIVMLLYIISLLTVQMNVHHTRHKGYAFVGICYAFYVFIILFYFSKDTIPMVILMSVLYAFMTQILMNYMVAALFSVTAIMASTALLFFRNGQLLDIGIGFYVTLLLVILSAFYASTRYIDLLKQYTERIQEQVRDLTDSEERNNILHRASRELIWDYDLQTKKRYFPDIHHNEFGEFLSASPHIEDWVADLHPEDAPMLLDLFKEVEAGTRDYFETEFRHLSPNGNVHWYSVKTVSLKNEGGQVEKMAGSYTWIHDRKIKELEIEHLAFNDELTELPNRAAFFRDVTVFREMTGATGESFLQYLDIQSFREINSTFGHGIGDSLIVSIADRLKQFIPSINIYKLTSTDFGIWGLGDEKEAVEWAKEVLSTFNEPYMVDQKELFIQARIGISLYPSDAADASSLLQNADTALSYCRKDDVTKFMIYNPDMTNTVYNKMNMLNLMHQALEKKEFFMVYQPLIRINTVTPELYGFESLLRWKNQQLGFIPPDQFIPLAEESGLIHSIGAWILEDSCRFISEISITHPDIVVSINISAKQFASDTFLEILETTVENSGVSPHNLCLEITETSFIESFEDVQSKFQYIKFKGYQLALDDFGTGYSSLNYLGQLNIDTLKIDKSFTAKVIKANSDFFLIKSIISLSKDLGLRFVAEGVETTEQLKLLQSIDCPIIQGYYFARPLQREDALAFTAPEALYI